MKIEPVFLIAPESRPATMPTRRAVLIAIGSGVVGVAAGHFGGQLLSVRGEEPTIPTTPPTDDAERYRWALQLTSPSTPIAEIHAAMLPLLGVVNDEFARGNVDERLWRGVHRIAEHTLQMSRSEARQISFVLLPTLRLRADDARASHCADALERLVR